MVGVGDLDCSKICCVRLALFLVRAGPRDSDSDGPSSPGCRIMSAIWCSQASRCWSLFTQTCSRPRRHRFSCLSCCASSVYYGYSSCNCLRHERRPHEWQDQVEEPASPVESQAEEGGEISQGGAFHMRSYMRWRHSSDHLCRRSMGTTRRNPK